MTEPTRSPRTLIALAAFLWHGALMAFSADYYVPEAPVTFSIGAAADQFDDVPGDMALLPSGELVARDQSRVHVINDAFQSVARFACPLPSPPGASLFAPSRPVAVDLVGRIITHCSGVGVAAYSREGVMLRMLAPEGDAEGAVRLATGITVMPSGQIVVADDLRWRVLVFAGDGTFVGEWSPGVRYTVDVSFDRRLRALPDGARSQLVLFVRAANGRITNEYRTLDGALIELGSGGRTVRLTAQPGYGDGSAGVDFSRAHVSFSGGRFIVVPTTPGGAGVGLSDFAFAVLSDLRGSQAENLLGVARLTTDCDGPSPIVLADGDMYACDRIFRRVGRVLRPGGPVPPSIELRKVAQRQGLSLVDVEYRVNAASSTSADVFLFAQINGERTPGSFRRLSLVEATGPNMGFGQPVNVNRALVWDAAADLGNATGFANASIAAVVRRGGLMEFRFVTVPAGIPDSSHPNALEISATPVFDYELIPVWQFLLASGDPSVTIIEGSIRRAADGVELVSENGAISAAGRAFLLAQAGVRLATADEAARARIGSTPGEQFYGSTHNLLFAPVSNNELGIDLQCPAPISQCASARTSGYLVVPLD